MNLFRAKWFWAAFGLVSVLSAFVAFRFFGTAFPIVALDIKMDRAAALERARELADRFGWGPGDYRQAASFGVDSEVQNFVELEGGGKEAFTRLLEGNLYSPYTWRVRHFKELTTNSTEIRFRPDGTPDGFRERLPESQPGAALETEAAREIAESAALRDWGFLPRDYPPVEQSQEVRPGGRVDHTFVYESPLRDIGEGRYRLRLVVGGDKLVEVTRFIQIPEAFQRRYEQMRSFNNTIGVVGSVAMALLYIVGGCFVGLFFLMRRGWVLWKTAVVWAVFIGLLQTLAEFNQWPLAWMQYDTAQSYSAFTLQRITLILVQFVVLALVLGLSLMAAESLTRKAFPEHPRLWGLWSGGIANSTPVLGRTVAGYLLVPLFFLYEVGLYYATSRTLGWWSPSDALVQPDVLANYFPWLTALAVSAQAGFWEECLFRAIPLAGAALLGERFGGKKIWIGAALLVQAVIFGAGHAPYPAQPAYARVAELIIPSLFFGAIYLLYGLLPGIVLHFTFDVVWFAIPVFLSTAPGAWIDKTALVVLTLVPLWVVLGRRWRRGKWESLPDEAFNRSWSPPVEEATVETAESEPATVAAPPALAPGLTRATIGAGIVGLALWGFFGNFRNDAGKLSIARGDAATAAREALAERGVQLEPPWRTLPTVAADVGEEDRFVWSAAGPETYRGLLGRYLAPPVWNVRFARFEGDLEQRAEEYLAVVGNDGKARRVRHEIPEARPGESFPVERARQMALERIAQAYGLGAESLREISAEPSQRPARVDWRFAFADKTVELPQGETRVVVEIAGAEVVDSYRGIHVPEEWSRERRNRDTIVSVIRILCSLLLGVLYLAGLVGAAVYWSRRGFPVRTALVFGAFTILWMGASFANQWPAVVAGLSTAQPFTNQVLVLLFGILLSAVFAGGAMGLNAGFAKAWRRAQAVGGGWTAAAGFSVGFLAVGVGRLAGSFQSAEAPDWPSFASLNASLPILATAVSALLRHLAAGVLLLLVYVCLDRYSEGFQRRRLGTAAALLLFGLLAGGISAESPDRWLASGLALGIFFLAAYVLWFRFDLGLIPPAAAGALILGLLEQAWIGAFPGAAAGAVVAVLAVALQALLWWRGLNRTMAS